MVDQTPPQLTDGYSKCRTVTVAVAAFIFLGLYSPVTLPETIPVIGIAISDKGLALLALALVGFYQLARMVIEWFNSSSERRKTIASKIDFLLAVIISVSALTLWGFRYFDFEVPKDFSFVQAILLTLYGVFLGGCLASMIFSLNFVRSKDEALQLGLPRIPVATRASLFLVGISVFLIVPIYIASLFFSDTMQRTWLTFCAVPAAVMVIVEVLSRFSKKVRLRDGSLITRKDHIRRLQQVFDAHDSHYQVGGWDRPADVRPSRFFKACEHGDLDEIKELLAKGASPDERGHLGWTPLMIATAQGHETAVHILLEAGANPNVVNIHGRSPLMFASRYGSLSLVNMLLSAKADPSLKADPETGGPIMAATASGFNQVIVRLLRAGADTSVVDREGRTLVQIAELSGHGDSAKLLRRWLRETGR